MGRLCYPTQHPGRIQVPRASGARKLSRCKEGMARVFAVQVQSCFNITRVAVQGWSEPRVYLLLQSFWRALEQCQVTNCLEGRNLSRCKILMDCRCACPGARTITDLSWVQEQKQKP